MLRCTIQVGILILKYANIFHYTSFTCIPIKEQTFLCELFKGSRGHYFNVTMKQWHPITNTTFLSECKIVYYSILRKLPSLSSMKSQSFVSTLMKTFLQEMLLLHVVLRQNYVIVTCLICKFIGGDYLISVVFRC